MNLTNREYLEAAIASIKILKHHNSPLTEQERGILLAFPGGGILKECGVFTDEDKPRWLVEGREELRSLLTPEEWEGVQNSGMQNSHYTLPAIRQAMWEAIMPLLPHNDHIQVLDPGCGTAGFLWSMPNDVRLEYHGIDKDILPVAIAQKAIGRGKHRIMKRDFLEYDPNPLYKYGVAIGNVPFVNGINSMKVDGKKLGIAIHAQFFIKSVQCLAPGGVLCFLTSTSTLDSKGEDYVWFRKWLHRKCEFIGALRLPADAVHYGGTQVTTDLVILRKRSQDSNESDPNWIDVVESDLINPHYNIPVLYNRWFIDHPECLLGDRTVSKVRGKNGNPTNCLALISRPDFLKELREALSNLTQQTNVLNKENCIMAAKQVIIADDKFTKCSLLSFILIENPTQEGIEIHFPSDRSFDALTTTEQTLLNQIKEQGFVPTQTHPHKFYIGFKKRTPDEYNRVISYMRGKVAKCAKFGAKEIKIDKVDELPSCRVTGTAKTAKSESATASSAPIVDAIAAKLQPMFDELSAKIQIPQADPTKIQELEAKVTEYLHRWQKDQETFKTLKTELDVFVGLNEELKKENEALRSHNNELIAENLGLQKEIENLRSQVEGFSKKILELQAANHSLADSLKESVQECRDLEQENKNLKMQLADFGVGAKQPDEDIDLVDDEVDLDDDVDLTDDDEELPSAFQAASSGDDNTFDTSAIGGDDDDDFDTSLLMGE